MVLGFGKNKKKERENSFKELLMIGFLALTVASGVKIAMNAYKNHTDVPRNQAYTQKVTEEELTKILPARYHNAKALQEISKKLNSHIKETVAQSEFEVWKQTTTKIESLEEMVYVGVDLQEFKTKAQEVIELAKVGNNPELLSEIRNKLIIIAMNFENADKVDISMFN